MYKTKTFVLWLINFCVDIERTPSVLVMCGSSENSRKILTGTKVAEQISEIDVESNERENSRGAF